MVNKVNVIVNENGDFKPLDEGNSDVVLMQIYNNFVNKSQNFTEWKQDKLKRKQCFLKEESLLWKHLEEANDDDLWVLAVLDAGIHNLFCILKTFEYSGRIVDYAEWKGKDKFNESKKNLL